MGDISPLLARPWSTLFMPTAREEDVLLAAHAVSLEHAVVQLHGVKRFDGCGVLATVPQGEVRLLPRGVRVVGVLIGGARRELHAQGGEEAREVALAVGVELHGPPGVVHDLVVGEALEDALPARLPVLRLQVLQEQVELAIHDGACDLDSVPLLYLSLRVDKVPLRVGHKVLVVLALKDVYDGALHVGVAWNLHLPRLLLAVDLILVDEAALAGDLVHDLDADVLVSQVFPPVLRRRGEVVG
mmetsp:Transcript_43140/g.137191  ORF Transcript_43140/g.137191 Transcript_43140/m.137191 type:complete len:243 (+) Transcript_43140:35-763(+)